MLEPQLSPTRPEELPAILGLARAIGTFTADELDCLRDDIEAYFEELAAGGSDDALLTLHLGGEVAGFMQYGPLPITAGSFMLHWILVDKRHQGAGLGRFLMERMEAGVASAGGQRIFIETADTEDFVGPRKVYLRHGYAQVATLPDYYGEQNSKCVFCKTL